MNITNKKIFASTALLPDGWSENTLIEIDEATGYLFGGDATNLNSEFNFNIFFDFEFASNLAM